MGEFLVDNSEKGRVTRAQIQAQEAADFFKDFVPLETHSEIESIADIYGRKLRPCPGRS